MRREEKKIDPNSNSNPPGSVKWEEANQIEVISREVTGRNFLIARAVSSVGHLRYLTSPPMNRDRPQSRKKIEKKQ